MSSLAPSVSEAEMTAFRRGLIMATVIMASTLYAMTILVVSVILPQMQGSLSATQDQIAWAMTFNILATAIVTPMTGWLAARLGRRMLMIGAIAGFGISTLFCGISDSLGALVFWRILQGAFGAPVIPMTQAVLLDTYPKEQHSMVTSVFGMAVVIGPVIGPVLGGYLSDLYSWRWAFYMILPFTAMALVGLIVFLPDKGKTGQIRFDWTGFLALSVAIGCFQLMLDRGQRLDWFESAEIAGEALLAALALYIFIVHSLSTSHPFLNLRLLLDRNYALGLVLVCVYGMLNFTPMVLLPPLLQGQMGYPDAVIGALLAARGVGAIGGFFLSMFVGKLDPRVGMLVGFGIQAWSGWIMMGFDLNVGFWDVAFVSALQGLSVGLIWVPLTVATFSTLDQRYLAESSAIYHLLRNLGSSLFISLSVAALIRAGRTSYAELAENVTVFNKALSFPSVTGPLDLGSIQGLGSVAGEMARQSAMLGYLTAFAMYTAACVVVLPLVLAMRVRRAADA